MKRGLCLFFIVGAFFLRLIAAAEEYSPEDYIIFRIAHCIADDHFSLLETVNQELKLAARASDQLLCPGSYWFSDQRNAEPDPTQTASISQGLLFNPQTRTLYSRFGAWCFSSEAMYKVPHSHCVPRMPKGDILHEFAVKFFEMYHMELSNCQGLNGVHEVRAYLGTRLPIVIFEEPPFGVPPIESASFEEANRFVAYEVVPEEVPVSAFSRFSFKGIAGFFSRLIDRLRLSNPTGQTSEVGDQLESVCAQSSKNIHAHHTPDQEHLLAIWREMNRRYQSELK